jgi:small subunit ribosomal protein S16
LPLRIRLKRVGAKRNPHYRIVVAHPAKPRDGEAVETLGHYDPRSADPKPVLPNPDRALHWLLTGAQPTDTVRSLLRKAGVWAEFAKIRDQRKKGKQRQAPPAPE